MDLSPRRATERAVASGNRQLDVSFDVDLGEIVEGHHVVARGIEIGDRSDDSSSELHYEFVPGLIDEERATKGFFFWLWTLSCSDDAGTVYKTNNGGAFDGTSGGDASHGVRDLGGRVPPEATRLTIQFRPSDSWVPTQPWRRQIVVDLREKRLLED